MELKLYNFSKRSNSTKVPAESSAFTTNVTLKENTSLYSPSFLLAGNPTNYNYCKWNGKYYYINDYIYEGRNTYTITCTMDVLATYKSSILASSAFVLYSSSNYDTYIPDTRLSMKAEPDWVSNTQVNFLDALGRAWAIGDEQYVVTYVGTVTTIQEGTPTMVVSKTALKNLINSINTNSFSEVIARGFWNKLLSNASQAIVKVTKIPFHAIEEQEEPRYSIIMAGSYSTGVSGVPAKRNVIYNTTIAIPWQHHDFRDTSAYTSMLLYLPGLGWVNLNPDDYIGYDNITIKASVDEVTGTIAYTVGNCETFQCCVGTDVPVSTIQSGVGLGTLASVGGAMVNAAIGNVPAAVASGFNAFATSMQKSTANIGGYTGGNMVYANYYQATLYTICHDTTIEPSAMTANYGRPCNKVLSLANLTGYVQTRDARVSVNASDEVNDSINNMLDGGVYFE